MGTEKEAEVASDGRDAFLLLWPGSEDCGDVGNQSSLPNEGGGYVLLVRECEVGKWGNSLHLTLGVKRKENSWGETGCTWYGLQAGRGLHGFAQTAPMRH